MKLYEIDKAMLDLVDEETGEIKDYEAFEALQMERDEKIESVALWIKDLRAEAVAIKQEEAVLAERRKAAENKAERLKQYIDRALQGQRFSTPKVSVSYRVSSKAEIGDNFVGWAMANNRDDLLTYKEPTANKTAVKEAIKNGEELQFASIVATNNISIK